MICKLVFLFWQKLFLGVVLMGGLTTLLAERQEGLLNKSEESLYTISFQDVPVVEFIQFASRISDKNFIFNHRDLQFNIAISSGKPVSSDQVILALIQILRAHGLSVSQGEEGYFVIHKGGEFSPLKRYDKVLENRGSNETPYTPMAPLSLLSPPVETAPQFLVYKLQYHAGDEIETAVKKIAADLALKRETSPRYLEALQSVQWIKSTNSLVCSGDDESLKGVKQLLQSLDAPLRQVFIEILVIETDSRKTSDFGLQWAAGGRYQDHLGFGTGNFPPSRTPGPFALNFQSVDASHPPSGPSQFPLGNGFDLGVIGDLILHKGKSFLSLGALISALQSDGDSSIVLNQKIITQDNKNSTIFVGDNIPFTGSIVQTVGTGQQTTANIEYRDIGVNLSITPKLGEADIITLDLNQEITEAIPTGATGVSPSHVSGIQTTKTNMMTHVHVPDRSFLVVTGMMRNAKNEHQSGIPCLGGIPGIGKLLFSKTEKRAEKRNVMIFVRPTIIKSAADYQKITEKNADLYDVPEFKEIMNEDALSSPSKGEIEEASESKSIR